MPQPIDQDFKPASWLNRLARHGGRPMLAAMALPLVGAALLLIQAAVLAGLVHELVVAGRPIAALIGPLGLLVALLLLRALLGSLGDIAAVRAGELIKQRLRHAIAGTLFARTPGWTGSRPSGALSGLMLEQTEAMDGYFVRYLPAMLQAAIVPLAFAIVIFPIDWVVALLFLVTAPLIPLFMALVGWGAEAATTAQATALSRLSARFADRLRGLVTLRLAGQAAAEVAAIRTASEELRQRTMRVMRIAFLSSAVLEFFAALGVAGVALYIGLTFLDLVSLRADPLTLSAGLFCLLMAPEIYQPLRLLAAHYHDRASARAAAEQIVEQLEAVPDLAAVPMPATAGEAIAAAPVAGPALPLRLAGLGLATPDGRTILTDGNLDLRAGEHVAILGDSGIGKSTLLEAAAGLRAHSGHILIGGTEVRDAEEEWLRAHVAVLGQRPRLFATSIAENIRLGRRDACHLAVQHAAERAGVMDFAAALPRGLDTPVGQGGTGLSGGEAQRVALARLYLRDPALILLDEPTAHLDLASEDMVMDGLVDFARGRTMLVVTHSATVAARMDGVWRLVNRQLLPAPRPQRVRRPGARSAA